RPLFPEGFRNEVQVYVYVISGDQENDSDVLGLIAASYALSASKIPWNGPVGGVRVGRIQGKWVLNPTFQQLAYSDMEVVVAGTADSINMVEGGCLEVSETDMLEALTLGHKGIKEIVGFQQELLKQAGTAAKMPWSKAEPPADLVARLKAEAESKIVDAINQKEKHTRIQAVEEAKRAVSTMLAAENAEWAAHVGNLPGDIEYNALRSQVLDTGRRVDGRSPTEVRPITIDSSVLPRAHGSALFTRGQTQALVSCTLGTADDVQRLDSIKDSGEVNKTFMLHYN